MTATVIEFYNKKAVLLRTLTVTNPRKWAMEHFIKHPHGYLAIYHEGHLRYCFTVDQVDALKLPK